jgi:outer membrane protein assembly factor BamB
MPRISPVVVTALAIALGCGAALQAQRRPPQPPAPPPGKANWPTDGYDTARSSWQRHETLISPTSVKGMKLVWKLKLDNASRQLHNLFPPMIVSDVRTTAGPKQIGVVAGVSDNLYGIDLDTGTQLWKKTFDNTFTGQATSRYYTLCPGGLTATPVIGPGTKAGQFIAYAVSWDGRLRQVDVATGQDAAAPELFLPPNGKPYGLNLYKGVVYTTTAQGCGGNPNQFYAFDLATKKVGSFNPGSGGMWPRLGPTIGRDGSVYAGSGDGDYYPEREVFGQSIVAVKQNPLTKALEMSDWYTPSNAIWLRKRDLDMNVTGPVFEWKGKEYLAEASKECRVWLLDTSAMGGEDHRTPVDRTPLICNESVHFAAAGPWSAISTWEDTDGTRWVLLPFWGPKHPEFKAPIEHGETVRGAVAAFKLEEQGGKVRLAPAWVSRDINQADHVVIANGVVFAFGNGVDATQSTVDIGLSYNDWQNRAKNSTHAELHAFDARTGEELWSSGSQIATFNHFTSLSLANGRVYIGTHDGTLYAFGVDRDSGPRSDAVARSAPRVAGRTLKGPPAAGRESPDASQDGAK